MEARTDSSLLATTQAGLAPFQLYRPGSLDEAVAAMSNGRAPVCFYAGGTDIFAAFREGLRPGSLIWLDRLEGSTEIAVHGDALVIGAGVTHMQAVSDSTLGAVPGLASAWSRIATVRIRRHATLGGNLMARRARYEMSILLSALSATVRIATAAGVAEHPVEALWELPPDEPALLLSVAVPLAGSPRLDYARDLRPTMTQALCLRQPSAGLPKCRVAVATEYCRPFVSDLREDEAPVLPTDFGDTVANPRWLAQVARTQFQRQKERLEEA